MFSGQPFPSADHAGQGNERHHEQAPQHQGVERTAAEAVLRQNVIKPGRERGRIQQDEEYGPQSRLNSKKSAAPQVFSTAMEQISCQHRNQD